MSEQVKPVLTGEAFNPSIEWVLNLAMELIQHNGGSLSAAVIDVLNAINCLKQMTVAPLEDLQRCCRSAGF